MLNSNSPLVTVTEQGTVQKIETTYAYPIMTSLEKSYIREANEILDTLSKNYNRLGIDSIIGALILQTTGNSYYGKENE
jgi:hypothetical protein